MCQGSLGEVWPASEAIIVLNQHYTLPGLGSYVAVSVEAQNLRALGLAICNWFGDLLAARQSLIRPVNKLCFIEHGIKI